MAFHANIYKHTTAWQMLCEHIKIKRIALAARRSLRRTDLQRAASAIIDLLDLRFFQLVSL